MTGCYDFLSLVAATAMALLAARAGWVAAESQSNSTDACAEACPAVEMVVAG